MLTMSLSSCEDRTGLLNTQRKRVTCRYNVQQYSDIIVTFSDRRIFGHKAILAASSMYFHRAFSSGFAVCTHDVFP